MKTKTVSIKENRGLSDSPHKNQDQFNGEVHANHEVKIKNTDTKRVYLESSYIS